MYIYVAVAFKNARKGLFIYITILVVCPGDLFM